MKKRTATAKPQPMKLREQRYVVVPFEKHKALPSAFDSSGLFIATGSERVYAWRHRSGQRPSWHTCTVVRATPDLVELWDETLGQWFCFDLKTAEVPDVRMLQLPPIKPPSTEVQSS